MDKILAGQPLKVPVMLVHSLWDQEDIYGAIAVYQALEPKDTDNDKVFLVMGPWHHGQEIGDGSTLGALRFDSDTGLTFRREILRPFLDRYLKDGAPKADVAPVAAFETGDERLAAPARLAGRLRQRLLDPADAALSRRRPPPRLRRAEAGGCGVRGMRLRPRQTRALPRPALGGYQLMVSADIFRGRYRGSLETAKPIAPNQPLLYRFALPTANHVFLPGHRIMVQVQSSWFPLYDRNPQTFVPSIFWAKPGTTGRPCSGSTTRPARRASSSCLWSRRPEARAVTKDSRLLDPDEV